MTNSSEYLKSYFSNTQPYNSEERRHSSLILGLRDARLITNRDLTTGEVSLKMAAPLMPNNWGGAIIYLITLELIGSCFKPKESPALETNSIFNALSHFSSLTESEARAIEALRHSFAHNYGLINIQRRKNNEIVVDKTHHFLLTADPKGNIVNEREEFWDGNFDSRSEKNTTVINIWRLGDMVEAVFKKLVEENNKENIQLILSEGLKELKAKYTVII